MAKINTYGYFCVKHNKWRLPLFVVEICSTEYNGVHIFSNNKDAADFIQNEKTNLKDYYGIDLKYDYDFYDQACNNSLNYTLNSTKLFSNVHNREIYGCWIDLDY